MAVAAEPTKPVSARAPCPTSLNRCMRGCGGRRTGVPPALAAYASV